MLCRLIRFSCIFASNKCFVLQHFEHGNAVELCNGVMFHFYSGLPHIECLVSVELGKIPSLCKLHLPQVWRPSPQELVLFTVMQELSPWSELKSGSRVQSFVAS